MTTCTKLLTESDTQLPEQCKMNKPLAGSTDKNSHNVLHRLNSIRDTHTSCLDACCLSTRVSWLLVDRHTAVLNWSDYTTVTWKWLKTWSLLWLGWTYISYHKHCVVKTPVTVTGKKKWFYEIMNRFWIVHNGNRDSNSNRFFLTPLLISMLVVLK